MSAPPNDSLGGGQAIGSADFDLRNGVEHVKFGQRQAGETVEPGAITDDHSIKPAGAARVPGRRAVFVADLAQLRARLVVQFSRKRPGANGGGIRFCHADNVRDQPGRQAGADGGVRRDRV